MQSNREAAGLPAIPIPPGKSPAADAAESPSAKLPVLNTRLLMALATVLIVNSHLEQFYPRSWLAGDGLLGNSIFFFLAGFGLARSELNRTRSFPSWFWRRIVRIYPSLLLVMIVFAVGIEQGWRSWSSMTDPLAQLVWPTPYTFVTMVVPFYILFFPLVRMKRPAFFAAAIVLLAFVGLAAYVPDLRVMPQSARLQLSSRPLLLQLAAYLQVMLLGGWIGMSYRRPVAPIRWRLLATSAVFATYVLLKYFMVTGRFARGYVLLYVLVAVLCGMMFDLLCGPDTVKQFKRWRPVWLIGSFIGAMTLEIYLVHPFIDKYSWVVGARFPLNIVVLWCVTIPLATIAERISRVVQNYLRNDEPAVVIPASEVQLQISSTAT